MTFMYSYHILIKLIDLLFKRLISQSNMEICFSFKSFAGGTYGFIVSEETEVAYLKSVLCIVIKKTFRVTSFYFVACRHLRNDDLFTICPTHRCWLESWFQ